MNTFTVTLAYPTIGSRLSDIAVNGTATTRPDGKREQTVTRDELCLVVCALGGCAECDERGGDSYDRAAGRMVSMERVIVASVYLVVSVLFLRVAIPPESAEKAVLVSRLPALIAWALASVVMVLTVR